MGWRWVGLHGYKLILSLNKHNLSQTIAHSSSLPCGQVMYVQMHQDLLQSCTGWVAYIIQAWDGKSPPPPRVYPDAHMTLQ